MQKVVSSPEYADKIYRYIYIYIYIYCKGVRNAPFEVKRTGLINVTASFFFPSSDGLSRKTLI